MQTYFIDPSSAPSPEDLSRSNVDFNRRMIREVHAGNWKSGTLSTSQKVMVGLALCRPKLLAAGGYPEQPRACARLDDDQRHAIVTWWQSAVTELTS